MVTKEQMEQKQLEQLKEDLIINDNLQKLKETKQQRTEALENTWYKLYMLMNYNITMDMFKGTPLRWTTVQMYHGVIRAIYNGHKYQNPFPPSLLQYIQGLMDSGTEPYSLPNGEKKKVVSIQELLDSKTLTKYQINEIYSSVGQTEEDPDTSTAWTCCSKDRGSFESSTSGFYTSIVQNMTNPLQKPQRKAFSLFKL